jgi:hypothetical protein
MTVTSVSEFPTWGYKFTREIACRMPHFRGLVLHPAFAVASGSSAAIVPHAEDLAANRV